MAPATLTQLILELKNMVLTATNLFPLYILYEGKQLQNRSTVPFIYCQVYSEENTSNPDLLINHLPVLVVLIIRDELQGQLNFSYPQKVCVFLFSQETITVQKMSEEIHVL